MIRLANADDRGFIFSSWLQSYAETAYPPDSKPRTPLPKVHFMAAQGLLIRELLRRGQCLVMASPVDEAVIRGYVVGESRANQDDVHCTPEMVIHWAYTRPQRRHAGVCSELVGEMRRRLKCGPGGVYSHLKNPGGRWLDAMGLRFCSRALEEIGR